jgi:hypothetical protein
MLADNSNLYSTVGGVQMRDGDEQTLARIADTCRWYAADGRPTAQRQAGALAELMAGLHLHPVMAIGKYRRPRRCPSSSTAISRSS